MLELLTPLSLIHDFSHVGALLHFMSINQSLTAGVAGRLAPPLASRLSFTDLAAITQPDGTDHPSSLTIAQKLCYRGISHPGIPHRSLIPLENPELACLLT